MRAWPSPETPRLPGFGPVPTVHDTAAGELVPSASTGHAGMYVCGITPYDATHMGHAATYVAFDLLHRAWRDAGLTTRYVQNVTDVDDPLLERAHATGMDWKALAERETQLFREDMTALRVLPPDAYLAATETVPWVVRAVTRLCNEGAAYRVPVEEAGSAMYPGACDVYFDISADTRFGVVSGWTREHMLRVYPERGGDPNRAGKRDPLDPLLWRAARTGEPCWDGDDLGQGRPGWHIECAAIALEELDHPFQVNGGGSDLVFPHHEMSASHAHCLRGAPYARAYMHSAMVGLNGEKMSKSKGNLVLVSQLRRQGEDPMAIRLALLAHHYRSEWSWTSEGFAQAKARLARWRLAVDAGGGADPETVLERIRAALGADLDTPTALAAIDRWADSTPTAHRAPGQDAGLVPDAVDSLLGILL